MDGRERTTLQLLREGVKMALESLFFRGTKGEQRWSLNVGWLYATEESSAQVVLERQSEKNITSF